MKVCVFAPGIVNKGGIAHYSKEIFYGLLHGDAEIFLISNSNKPKELNPNVFKKYTLSPLNQLSTLQFLKRKRIEVLHLQYAIPSWGLYTLGIFIVLALSRYLLKIKIVITFHEVSREIKMLRFGGKLFFWFFTRLAHHCIVHTKQAEDILLQNGCKDKNVTILPHFILPKKTMNFSKNMSSIQIMQFGFIHVDKGIEHTIRAFQNLLINNPDYKNNVRLYISGEVRERKGIFKVFEKKDLNYLYRIKNIVKENQLGNNVIFEDYIEYKKLNDRLEQVDIFILPYTNTEQSGVLHTLIPYGKPIIASNIGGLAETLSRVGFLVKPGDHTQIERELKIQIEQIMKGVAKPIDYSQIIKFHSIQNITTLTLNIYKKVINGN